MTRQHGTTQPGMAELIAGWAPEPEETTETITAGPAVALSGLLDRESPVTGSGDPLPPLWHWLYFLERPAQSELGPDGHPAASRFMPPVPRRRRMFAGGRATYREPIRCGQVITRRSELANTTVRHGRTGELLFVTVRSFFISAGTTIATEEQDLVYRSGPPPSRGPGAGTRPGTRPGAAPGAEPSWHMRIVPDPVLLFRFSALTYNAHRIHYDATYATTVEGHGGLVVHGPLLALLCLELPRRHVRQPVTRLSFRAQAPVYAGQTITVTGRRNGEQCTMAVTAPDGTEAMTAEGDLAS